MVAYLEKMLKTENIRKEIEQVSTNPFFPPLSSVNSPTVDTVQGAFYLNRKPQTLRIWACKEKGPLRPKRINGRLHWSVNDIRHLLGDAS